MPQDALCFETFRNNPNTISESLKSCAQIAAYNLGKSFALDTPTELCELSTEVFSELYDPSLPTIGMDSVSIFESAETVAMANAQKPDRRCNIVILAPLGSQMSVSGTDSNKTLEAQNGLVIDKKGRVHYGRFPETITIDVFESADRQLLGFCHDNHIPTLTDFNELQLTDDKRRLGEIASNVGVKVPRRYQVEDLTPDLDIVIKPSNELQGRGVFFGSEYPGDVNRWVRYHDFLTKHGYNPVVEERIRTLPLFSPQTDERLDWNIRALVSHGAHVASYMRIGLHDKAVNQGAGAVGIDMGALAYFLPRSVSRPHSMAARVIGKLMETANRYAELRPSFMAGLDLTVDQDGEEVVMFESNAGNVGGLEDITCMDTKFGFDPLKAARRILGGIERVVLANFTRISPGHPLNMNSLPLGLASRTYSMVHITGAEALLGAGFHDEDPHADKNSRLLSLAYRCGKEGSLNGEFDPAVFVAAVGDYALDLHSLESYVDKEVFGSPAVGEQIDGWLEIHPKSIDWIRLRVFSALDGHRFPEAKDIASRFSLFIDRKDVEIFAKSVARDVIPVKAPEGVRQAITDEMAEVITLFFHTTVTDEELRTSLSSALHRREAMESEVNPQESSTDNIASLEDALVIIRATYAKLFCAMERYDIANEVMSALLLEDVKTYRFLKEIVLEPCGDHLLSSPDGALLHQEIADKCSAAEQLQAF